MEYFSKLLGKETIRSINNSRSYGRQGSHSMSYNKTGRELMTPDELRVMDNNNCVLFIRGLYPFFTKKYTLENHPNYHLSGDASDDNLFNIQESFRTGRSAETPRAPTRAMRVMKDSERADAREADRQFRSNSRPVQRFSAKGKQLGAVQKLEDEFRSLGQIKDPNNPTPEELERLHKETQLYAPKEVVIPHRRKDPEEVKGEDYTPEQLDMFASFSNYWGIPSGEEVYEQHEAERGEE